MMQSQASAKGAGPRSSTATIVCSAIHDSMGHQSAWGCVLRVDDRIGYDDYLYYEIRSLHSQAADLLAVECEAVLAGLGQAVNAHAVSEAQIWVELAPLLETAKRASSLPVVEQGQDEEEGDEDSRIYDEVRGRVEALLQQGWAKRYTDSERKVLADFALQFSFVRNHAQLSWRQVTPADLVDQTQTMGTDHRKAQVIACSLLMAEHPETLPMFLAGRIVNGEPTEVDIVCDTPDLTGFGEMLLEDSPDRYGEQFASRELRPERRRIEQQPSLRQEQGMRTPEAFAPAQSREKSRRRTKQRGRHHQ